MIRRSRMLDGTMLTARVARWGGPRSIIRSKKAGTITIGSGASSNTDTIAAVDLANSRLVYLGVLTSETDSTQERSAKVALTLTNATTITATRNSTPAVTVTVSYEVIEYWPGVIKYVKRDTIVLTGVASNTATVQAVNTAKSALEYLGMLASGAEPNRALTHLVLTNSTTITATKSSATDNATISYQLVEYY